MGTAGVQTLELRKEIVGTLINGYNRCADTKMQDRDGGNPS